MTLQGRRNPGPQHEAVACWGGKSKQKTERRRAHDKPRSRDRDKGGIQNGRHKPEQCFICAPSKKFAAITARFEPPKTLQEECSPPPPLHVGIFSFARLTMREAEWCEADGLTTRLDIASPWESRFFS